MFSKQKTQASMLRLAGVVGVVLATAGGTLGRVWCAKTSSASYAS